MQLRKEVFGFLILAVAINSLSLSVTAQSAREEKVVYPAVMNDAPLLTGVLDASDAGSVFINGNRAQNGMTVLPGAQIETNGSDALITLNRLGKVRLCSQTKLNLNFNSEQIEVKLMNGSIRLDALPGVSGRILSGSDKVLTTDNSGMAITENYAAGCSSANGAPALIAPSTSFWSPFTTALSVIGGAVTLAAITSNNNSAPNAISAVQP